MAHKIAMWKADDGTIFHDETAALRRDEEGRAARAAMQPLGKPFGDRGLSRKGFIQHRREAVVEAKAALIRITRPRMADWFAEQEAKNPELNWLEVDGGYFCRMLDDGGPISRAWGRLMCIDSKHREWEQMYFALHPEEGEQVCVGLGHE